jgi:hypothetical protein
MNGRIHLLRPGVRECDSIVAAIRCGKAHFGRRIAREQRGEHIRIGGQLGHPRDTPRGIGVEMGLGTEKAFGDHVETCDVRG